MHETPQDEFSFKGIAPSDRPEPTAAVPGPLPVDGLDGLDDTGEPLAPLPSEPRTVSLSEILASAATPGQEAEPVQPVRPEVPIVPQFTEPDSTVTISFESEDVPPPPVAFAPAPELAIPVEPVPAPPPPPAPFMEPGPLPGETHSERVAVTPSKHHPLEAPLAPLADAPDPGAFAPAPETPAEVAPVPASIVTPLPPEVELPTAQLPAPDENASAEVELEAAPDMAGRKRPKMTVEIEDETAPQATSTLNPRHLVQEWLATMVKTQASDLILRSGGRPSQRLDGKISFLPGRVPGPGPMLEVLRGILGEKQMRIFDETGAADAALDLDGLGRFRINAYKQMGEPALVIRRINEDAPSLEDLNLPSEDLQALALRKRGLVLVTGVAGSGKSTTLSAMIEFMNRNVERHIVTLEDPVELLFKERYCVISQREVGTDTASFKQGLKHALRQSPDVIFIGEMRDAETVIAALEAIETGHLVLSTMHTVNAAQTVDRILGFFPAERHVQIRQRMADTLAGVLSMRLVQRVGGGLVPAYELMTVTPQVRELLEEGKTTELGRVIGSGMEKGLVAFNDCLADLVESGVVEIDEALATSDRPDELLMRLRGIQGGVRAAAKAQAKATEGQAPPAGREAPNRRLPDGSGGPAAPGGPGGPAGSGKNEGPGSGGLRIRGTGSGY